MRIGIDCDGVLRDMIPCLIDSISYINLFRTINALKIQFVSGDFTQEEISLDADTIHNNQQMMVLLLKNNLVMQLVRLMMIYWTLVKEIHLERLTNTNVWRTFLP